MTAPASTPGDVIRVLAGLDGSGHDITGMYLTVVSISPGAVEATLWTGATPVHLGAHQIRTIHHEYRRTV